MAIKGESSQAALEFLTTYGWAFFVILIMIGTLAYFGILNPGKILPNRCSIGPEFECVDYQISATANTFKLRLKNNAGEPIDVSSITLGSESSTQFTCPTLTYTPPQPPVSIPPSAYPIPAWKSGEIIDFSWSGCNPANAGMTAGDKGKISIKINYYSVASGSSYTKEVNGEVLSTLI